MLMPPATRTGFPLEPFLSDALSLHGFADGLVSSNFDGAKQSLIHAATAEGTSAAEERSG
jgi:hypothetical protein